MRGLIVDQTQQAMVRAVLQKSVFERN